MKKEHSLSPLEEKLYDTLLDTLNSLTKRRLLRPEYLELLGNLRNAVKYVECYKVGCPKGKHNSLSWCDC